MTRTTTIVFTHDDSEPVNIALFEPITIGGMTGTVHTISAGDAVDRCEIAMTTLEPLLNDLYIRHLAQTLIDILRGAP